MAELMLDQRAQLAEGLVVLGDQEQRIVAEPGRPARLAGQSAAAGALGLEPDRSGGSASASAQRNAAPRRSSGVSRESLEHLAIVGLVVGGLAGVPRREDAGRTVEGVDRQARIVGEHPDRSARASSDAFLRALPAKVSASSTTSGAAGKSSTERIVEPLERAGSAPTAGRSARPSPGTSCGCESPEPARSSGMPSQMTPFQFSGLSS